MPARVVVVYDDREFVEQLATAIGVAGYDVAVFIDPMDALNALDTRDAFDTWRTLEVLVTRVRFAPGKLNGVALSRMARSKRPGIRVLFAALPEFAEYVEGLGKFMPLPVSVPDIVDAVRSLVESDHYEPN